MTTDLGDGGTREVLLDVDGTLCENLSQLCAYAAGEHGVELAPADVTSWRHPIPAVDGHVGDLIAEATAERPEWFYLGMEPIPGAPEAATRLRAAGHTVRIATHRDPETHDLTRQWLAEHDIPHDGVVEDVPRDKSEVGGDLLIDDYHENVRDALAAGMGGALFRRPYSDSDACEGAVVADNWPDMLAELGLAATTSQS